MFEAVNSYIIAKPQLKGCLISITHDRYKIVGCPNVIENPIYQRNAFMFNLCMVIDAERKVRRYESAIRKLASAFRTVEVWV